MGFFKDFKDDFSEAADEMMFGGEVEDDTAVDSLEPEIDVDSELSKLDGLLEQVSKKVENNDAPAETADLQPAAAPKKDTKKETIMSDFTEVKSPVTAAVTDENAVITKGMTIRGDLETTGSVEVQGNVNGNIACSGKLVVTGHVEGNSSSAEFFADGAKIEGEVVTTGTAKIGAGSVVIGNISATSAVIAGAVKGDIDVQGPVVVDTSAVVMGNIKSRSVQINNGAVIEGFCSQSYSEVNVESIFG